MAALDMNCSDVVSWKAALSSYKSTRRFLHKRAPATDKAEKPYSLCHHRRFLHKPSLIPLDDFYTNELPQLIKQRNPTPYVTTDELSKLMQWKLSRGKWRPRLLDFVSSLNDDVVKSASQRAFESLPDVSKAVKELTFLKGVGPATASAVLAAYAPHVTPFMSDEAMEAAIGNSKEYTLKSYLVFVEKLQGKALELTTEEDRFTPSDVERALWSSAVSAKSKALSSKPDELNVDKGTKRKRKR